MIQTITLNGKQLPSYQTMGALLRFKQATGKEAGSIDFSRDMSDVITYLWCCVESACNRERVDFTMSLQDFADALTIEDVTKWSEQLIEAGAQEAKKKTVTA